MISTSDSRKLFYSWQSDSDERVNKILQRDILKAALKAIKREEPELAARLESDTSGAPGTPEIVRTIFERIDDSFCIASDISIINPTERGRKTPNPNVLLEMGYAAKVLTWERVITFFNTHYGNVEDLPFDLRGRRPTIIYHLSPEVSDEELQKAITNLSQRLQYHIKLVLNVKSGATSTLDEVKSAKLKRERDIKNLKAILTSVSTLAIERHIAFFQEKEVLLYDIFHYAINLQSFNSSPRFHLYDSELRKLLSSLTEALVKTLEYGQYFSSQDGEYYRFIYGDWYKNAEDEKAAQQLHTEMSELAETLRRFTGYVSENYLEIDLRKLNRAAIRNYKKEIEEIDARVSGRRKSKSK